MVRISVCVCAFLLLACFVLPMAAQQPAAASTNLAVPPMVNFSGVLTDVNGKALTGTVGVTFYLYQESQGGAPLWMETQNVQADKAGHYTAALGSTNSQGLPASVFASGEARWLGVQIQGQAEQPRVLLMSVPYALKALDAETIGGKPASSFMLAPAASGNSGKAAKLPPGTITGTGTAGFIPVFTGPTTIADSKIFQTVGLNVGVGTATPAAKLDVAGTDDIRDTLTLFPKLAHPTLSVHGTAFAVSSTGKVTFIAGQTFPGTGTVTSVGSGAGLTGGPITTSGTLSIKTAGVTNAMLAHSSLTVAAGTDLTGGGLVSLGGTTTLNLDTSKVPSLAGANNFTNLNAISVNSSSPDLSLSNAGSGDGIDISTASGNGVTVTAGPFGFRSQTATTDAVVAQGGFDGGYFIGVADGIFAEDDTDATFDAGLVGFEFGSTTETLGVWAYSASPAGFGVYGEQVNSSSSTYLYDGPSGVWGDSSAGVGVNGTSDSAYGVVGFTADTTGGPYAGGLFINNSGTGGLPTLYAYDPTTGALCTATTSGSFSCNGKLGVTVDVGSSKVGLSAIEGPESWFEDAGTARLSKGEAVVSLEPIFGQTVNTDIDYHVFLTPNGDCKGLYVEQKSATSFVVRELGGGTSNIAFDYRIMAKRKGYEQIRLADETKLMTPPRMAQPANQRGLRPPAPKDLQQRHKQMSAQRSVARLSTTVKH